MRKRTYHHGNLREALLNAAVKLIAEAGPAGFTLREAARRAGVSHNAPYRHFEDKDALLRAVATQGFRELGEAMRSAGNSEPTARGKLKQAGLAYVAFALRRPEHFTAMFDAPVPKREDPEYAQASEQAFGTLVECVRNCQDAGQLPPGNTMERALQAWALVHGIAKLSIARRLPFRSRAEVIKFTELAIDQSLGGVPALSN